MICPNIRGGFAELLRAFAEAELDAEKMIAYCEAIQNISATKRMAYLAEILEKTNLQVFLEYAQSLVNKKYTLFDAFGEETGVFVKDWKLRMNVSKEDILYLVDKQY
ncbi:MAG: hypothetical protein HC913_23950 [Microscillaceae bacterium]|nr:hypothetical protein [Microscillaceae bacterium]